MNTWIAGKDLIKHHYRLKKVFTANCIQNEDYTHVQKIFEELKVKNLGDYHDL